MKDNKPRKSIAGLLLLLLLNILIDASLLKDSPLYYEKVGSLIKSFSSGYHSNQDFYFQSNNLLDGSTSNSSDNDTIRKNMEKGGSITFQYNYIPSERSWDTMYTYSLYRYSPSGDCKFYCVKTSLDGGTVDLCSCLYSEAIWNELLDLVLDHGELYDRASVYDSNGMVVSTPIKKTVSLSNGVYCPNHIDDIEKYFKKLAVNAGVDESELDDNIRINDRNIENKESVTDLNGSFIFNPVGALSDVERQEIEDILWEKYRETGVRMYIILDNLDDTDRLYKIASKMNDRATSPTIAFCLTASRNKWAIYYWMDKDRESRLREDYEQVADAYDRERTVYEGLISAIEKAYELY